MFQGWKHCSSTGRWAMTKSNRTLWVWIRASSSCTCCVTQKRRQDDCTVSLPQTIQSTRLPPLLPLFLILLFSSAKWNKPVVVESLQWESKPVNTRLLVLCSTSKGRTGGGQLCCPVTNTTFQTLYKTDTPSLPPSPRPQSCLVPVHTVGVTDMKSLARSVPKIIDVAFPSWQTRLSRHFFHFPAFGESTAIPPFLLHIPREWANEST